MTKPSTSEFFTAEASKQLVLMDITGQVIMEKDIENTTVRLDIRNLNAGIYLIAVKENDAVKHIEKLVVSK